MTATDTAPLKRAASGRWPEILASLGDISPDILDGRHHPCPKCGGTDRFRLIDEAAGALFCNQCFRENNGDGIAALQWLNGWTFSEAVAALGEYLHVEPAPTAKKPSGKARIVATYDYRDERGDLLFQVVRLDPKSFRQRKPKPGGGWDWSVKGVRLVPYGLPELLAAPGRPALIVEGEKDVDRAASLGIIATTCAMGAGKWRDEYAEYFRGRIIYIVADNDQAGRDHARQVAKSLYGIAAGIKIIQLPGLPEKGDLSDWLDQGGSKNQLGALAKASPEWTPSTAVPEGEPATAQTKTPEPPPFVPFPTDTLPKVAADFIHEGAAALGCDESYIALPLLAVLASAVGNSRRIRLKRTWCEPAMVWAVVVGESGTLKSPAHDLAIEPIHKMQTAAMQEYTTQMQDFERDKAHYEADLAEWKKSGRKKGEPAPEPPAEPVAVRYLVNDCTVEALAMLLGQRPRGLLVARDELSGWVNSFDAYKNSKGGDVSHWLSMHRGGVLVVDRKSDRRMIHVPRASICIAGGIQPGALGSAIAKPGKEHFDNGLAARLLFAMPPRQANHWTEDELPWQTEAALETLVGRLMALDMPEDDNGQPQPRDIPLSPQGKQAWIAFYEGHAREQACMTGDLAAAWSKLQGYAARLALLVHLVRVESDDPTLADPGAVDEQSIAAGAALSRWFGNEAARVYAIIGGDVESPEARERRELVRIIHDHGGEITVRQLMRASRQYRSSADDAGAALHRLVDGGEAVARTDDHGGGPGRSALVFVLAAPGDGDTNTKIPEKTAFVSPSPPVTQEKTEITDPQEAEVVI